MAPTHLQTGLDLTMVGEGCRSPGQDSTSSLPLSPPSGQVWSSRVGMGRGQCYDNFLNLLAICPGKFVRHWGEEEVEGVTDDDVVVQSDHPRYRCHGKTQTCTKIKSKDFKLWIALIEYKGCTAQYCILEHYEQWTDFEVSVELIGLGKHSSYLLKVFLKQLNLAWMYHSEQPVPFQIGEAFHIVTGPRLPNCPKLTSR